MATIYLGRVSPPGSCNLPGTLITALQRIRRRATSHNGLLWFDFWLPVETTNNPISEQQSRLYRPCLVLLLMGVVWPHILLHAPVVSYTTFSPLPGLQISDFNHKMLIDLFFETWDLQSLGGLFLWPYPAGCPTPGVTRHHAPWSADFPQLCQAKLRSPDQPGRIYDTIFTHIRQLLLLTRVTIITVWQ